MLRYKKGCHRNQFLSHSLSCANVLLYEGLWQLLSKEGGISVKLGLLDSKVMCVYRLYLL